ncbi:MAG: arsenite methyltransferase [Anaerolineae bacterium]
MTENRQEDVVRDEVRRRYEEIARCEAGSCCCDSDCCGGATSVDAVDRGAQKGYTAEELAGLPQGADMSLGCGNPAAIAGLKPGETVLDLGSGGGIDCFLAARQVGETGQVIGVDMTPEMVSQARKNAVRGDYGNVEFRLGEIEHLPVADDSVDVIISNCVINLSTDKRAVLDEAYRVLRPEGRLAITDTVATAPLPEQVREDASLWSACIAGAVFVDDLRDMLQDVGFSQIHIRPKEESRQVIREWAPGRDVEEYVVSASIEAVKPT